MSEKAGGRPVLTRREAILGAIGAVGTAIAGGIAVNDKLEQNRIDQAVASKINTYKHDALEEKRVKQQSIKKAEKPTPVPAPPVAEVENVEQPEKPFTSIGFFRDGFSNDELAEFCERVKKQEESLDSIGINSARIQSYNERFKPTVDKILPLAGKAVGRSIPPEYRDLFHCLILAESIGNPDAISSTGAVGLAQVMPIGVLDSLRIVGNAWKKKPEDFGSLWDLVKKTNPATAKISNPKDFDPTKIKVDGFTRQSIIEPTVNIALGAVQFIALMDRFDDNLGMAISAYNAGSGKIKSAVDKYWALEGNNGARISNRPNYIEVFKKRKELGLENENNENWVYLPRILAIYRKIHGPQAFSLAA